MKSLSFIVALVMLFLLTSCARQGADIAIKPGTPTWEVAKAYAYAYERSRSRGERLTLAKKGMEAGEACIKETPKEAACYYYHAVNTGQYYQSKVVGYQNGLKQMVSDCQRVNGLKPSYLDGGGYRILGQIYTEVPAFTLKRGGIVRDLDKAVLYLLKAIDFGPKYPENWISLAKAYLKAGDKEEAALAIIKTKRFLPDWRDHDDYNFWKVEVRKLSKKLKKQIKDLQLSKSI